ALEGRDEDVVLVQAADKTVNEKVRAVRGDGVSVRENLFKLVLLTFDRNFFEFGRNLAHGRERNGCTGARSLLFASMTAGTGQSGSRAAPPAVPKLMRCPCASRAPVRR